MSLMTYHLIQSLYRLVDGAVLFIIVSITKPSTCGVSPSLSSTAQLPVIYDWVNRTLPQWQKSDDMTKRFLSSARYLAKSSPYSFCLSVVRLPTSTGTTVNLPFRLQQSDTTIQVSLDSIHYHYLSWGNVEPSSTAMEMLAFSLKISRK